MSSKKAFEICWAVKAWALRCYTSLKGRGGRQIESQGYEKEGRDGGFELDAWEVGGFLLLREGLVGWNGMEWTLLKNRVWFAMMAFLLWVL